MRDEPLAAAAVAEELGAREFDNDDLPVNGVPCNTAPSDQHAFRDMIVAIP